MKVDRSGIAAQPTEVLLLMQREAEATLQSLNTEIEGRMARAAKIIKSGSSKNLTPRAASKQPAGPAKKKRKKRSAAIRKRMSEAQKVRWAKHKKEVE